VADGDGSPVIVDELTIRQIKSARTRRRILLLPVRRDPLTGGADYMVRCPMKKDGVYKLFACGRVEHKCRQARREAPTRARAVLLFHDLVTGSVRTERRLEAEVTVTQEPWHDGKVWYIPIALGDLSGQMDHDVFLAGSGGDYTTSGAMQAVPGDPPVMFPAHKDMERARQLAKEKQVAPAIKSVEAMRQEVDTCKGVMTTMKTRNRMKLIAKELEKIRNELSVS
jgi:hypothetical protein